MSGDIEWLDIDWMHGAHRGQAMDAIAYGLREQAAAIKYRETSFVRRCGGVWDPSAEREYRCLQAAAGYIEMASAGHRGVAIEVANVNRRSGKEYQKMPKWLDALGDQMIAAFVAPIDFSTKGGSDAPANSRLESVDDGGAGADAA